MIPKGIKLHTNFYFNNFRTLNSYYLNTFKIHNLYNTLLFDFEFTLVPKYYFHNIVKL